MSQSVKPWIGIAAALSIVIIALGWFLVISPTLKATAETRDEISFEEDRGVTLRQALETLKSQYEDLDDYRAELDEIASQVPAQADSAAYRRTLVERAAAAGVTILSITTGVSTIVDVADGETEDTAAGDQAAEASETPEATEAAEEEVDDSAPSVTTSTGQTLVGVPVEIVVLGPYTNVSNFIASLQGTEGRLFLVQGIGGVAQLPSPASSGRPETFTGDVEMSIEGFLLVLTELEGSADTADGEEGDGEAVELPPLPDTERNPFASAG